MKTSALMSSLICCAVYAAVAAPPAPSHSNVEDVGLTDAPLRSLYPEIPNIAKVRGRARTQSLSWFAGLPCSSNPWPFLPLLLWEVPVLALQGAPKLKVAVVGSGLAGLSTAVELLDQGYEVDVFESRAFIGGKVASWQKDGNHVEMGLHVVRWLGSAHAFALLHLPPQQQALLQYTWESPTDGKGAACTCPTLYGHVRQPGGVSQCTTCSCCQREYVGGPPRLTELPAHDDEGRAWWRARSSSAATSTCSGSWPSAACWRTCC